jgi:predicted DNA-binding transcriptional regulator YafY
MTKKFKSKDQGLRFDVIDKLLKKRKGHTVKEITKHVNNALEGEDIKVDQRTIYSDLNDLRDKYKLNILKEGSRYKYADPNDGYRKPRAESADKETLALGLEAFASLKHLSFFDKFSDVVNRLLVGNLYEGIKDEEKKRIIQIGDSYNDSGYQYIEQVYQAIKNKTAIRILYNKGVDNSKGRTISPYILKEYRNQWYMVGYSKDSSGEPSSRVYALSKIDSLTILDQSSYVIDESFNADDYFKYSLGVYHDLYEEPIVVKLKFTGAIQVQRLKSYKLHSTMEVISMTDNEIVVRMKVYNHPELKELILGFKNEVVVLEPSDLRDEIKAIIDNMALLYQLEAAFCY